MCPILEKQSKKPLINVIYGPTRLKIITDSDGRYLLLEREGEREVVFLGKSVNINSISDYLLIQLNKDYPCYLQLIDDPRKSHLSCYISNLITNDAEFRGMVLSVATNYKPSNV